MDSLIVLLRAAVRAHNAGLPGMRDGYLEVLRDELILRFAAEKTGDLVDDNGRNDREFSHER